MRGTKGAYYAFTSLCVLCASVVNSIESGVAQLQWKEHTDALG